ncbi:MAG TPA: FG-GAP-like repeat-containing protein [Pseudoxanthomonas sp.]
MKIRLGTLALVAALAGCSGQGKAPQSGDQADGLTNASARAQADLASLRAISQGRQRSLGSAPDHGSLFKLDAPSSTEGAYTYRPIRLSEEHAMRAVVTGMMTVPTPDGGEMKLRYERHEEFPDGNWSWVGRVVGGNAAQEAIITFGEQAVFGTIPQTAGAALRITTKNGMAYLMEADPSRLHKVQGKGADIRVRQSHDLRAEAAADAQVGAMVAAAKTQVAQSSPASYFSASKTIDLVVGYTNGFATEWGSESAGLTRISNRITAANQALRNSRIEANIRVVRAVKVAYGDNTDSGTALEELTGSNGSASIPVPAALVPLRNARQEYGGDLVTLFRPLRAVQNGCGIAWLLGANGAPISIANDAPFGYSVVSDGEYDEDGNTYFCEDITLVHELAHNMGSQHDVANAAGTPGRYPYSYGLKSSVAAGNFFTVMAYGDDNQLLNRVFSNPLLNTCGESANRLCGVANQADNARSLRQTIPLIAKFLGTRVPITANGSRGDLYAIEKNGASVAVTVKKMLGTANYATYAAQTNTILPKTGSDDAWTFDMGDYNFDGVLDLFAIKKVGASNRTELHVLSGATSYTTFLLQKATPLSTTGSDHRWVFRVGDYNLDGTPDLYVINRVGASGKTEVYVLNGVGGYQTYLLQSASILGITGTNHAWQFELGDMNNDAQLDLYAINKVGTSATEVFVLNAVGGFKSYLLQKSTILGRSGTDNSWDFKVNDYNRDGIPDLYAIKKQAANNKTEIHVLNGSNLFQSYLTNVASALPATGTTSAWDFVVANDP